MSDYRKLPFWENIKRRKELDDYRQNVDKYFEQVDFDDYSRALVDNNSTKKIRAFLNKENGFIQVYLFGAGVSPDVVYTPPPAIGGYVQRINLVENLFNLFRYDIEHQVLIDTIDKAVGVYEKDFLSSIVRTLNPFFWLEKVLELIASIPFFLLGSLGFNRKKAEGSFIGKLLKWLIKFFTLLLAVWEGMARLKLLPENINILEVLKGY